jgi:1,2-diacylglycerol 3-beta-glucosyltransferase
VIVIAPVIALSLAYVVALFVVSRQPRPPAQRPPSHLFFVTMIPCLNEELVIESSLRRLAEFPPDRLGVLVIDDGSDDATPDLVRAWQVDHPNVTLLQRAQPEARQGKGKALNAGFRHLRDSGAMTGRDPRDVVVLVLDADGRLAPNALEEVSPFFRDPQAGAVQIGVRMYNADTSLLARLQDFEFVTYTEIFQRARQRVGSVGLGGNGQFARLSALSDLGDDPWTDCLTEDLDLGLRLLVAGHVNNFCPTTYVAQQAVLSPRRLLRQRSRWFQGHLQCLQRIPMILRSGLPLRAGLDLVQHLISPIMVLLTSILPVLVALSLIGTAISTPSALVRALLPPSPGLLLLAYLLGFGLSPIYAFAYWLRDGRISFGRALLLAHAFSLYSYVWFPAGWRAVWAVARGRRGWAKTLRTPALDPLGDVEPLAAAAL